MGTSRGGIQPPSGGRRHESPGTARRAGRALFGAGLKLAPACFLLLLCSCAPKPTVTLALLGDLMLGRDVHASASSLDLLQPDLQSADLRLANLESPLAETLPAVTGEGYNLCAPADNATLLSVWGFDLLAIANNHSFDCGTHGPVETAALLGAQGIMPLGLVSQPVYRQVNGLSLAFLAFDDVTSPLDGEAAAAQISTAREMGALVVVSLHWGMEYQGGASLRQVELANQFAEAGAALIWGHHPHVLQPGEWIDIPRGRTLVLYSLGNALFDQGGLDATRQSALLLVTLDGGGVVSTRALPFEIDIINSTLVQPDDETKQEIMDRLGLP